MRQSAVPLAHRLPGLLKGQGVNSVCPGQHTRWETSCFAATGRGRWWCDCGGHKRPLGHQAGVGRFDSLGCGLMGQAPAGVKVMAGVCLRAGSVQGIHSGRDVFLGRDAARSQDR